MIAIGLFRALPCQKRQIAHRTDSLGNGPQIPWRLREGRNGVRSQLNFRPETSIPSS
ncbi:TPA: hypothetical protein QEL76_003040 [Stenotrophomonas maltophilia]|nr:hypothetical protein [Stenotrophomonas maltophilia]